MQALNSTLGTPPWCTYSLPKVIMYITGDHKYPKVAMKVTLYGYSGCCGCCSNVEYFHKFYFPQLASMSHPAYINLRSMTEELSEICGFRK